MHHAYLARERSEQDARQMFPTAVERRFPRTSLPITTAHCRATATLLTCNVAFVAVRSKWPSCKPLSQPRWQQNEICVHRIRLIYYGDVNIYLGHFLVYRVDRPHASKNSTTRNPRYKRCIVSSDFLSFELSVSHIGPGVFHQNEDSLCLRRANSFCFSGRAYFHCL